MKRAPSFASEMVLLTRIFVSMRLAAGEPASSKYVSLSPPTLIRARYCSSLRGLQSKIQVAYVARLSVGTSCLNINSIVSEFVTQ